MSDRSSRPWGTLETDHFAEFAVTHEVVSSSQVLCMGVRLHSVWMCVCVCAHVCVCMHVCVHMHVFMHGRQQLKNSY